MIIKNAARCLKCGDVVESCHVHDFKWCSCKSMFVDGGREYIRRGGDMSLVEELSENSAEGIMEDEEEPCEEPCEVCGNSGSHKLSCPSKGSFQPHGVLR